MSNYHVEPADRPQALSSEAIKSLRRHQVKGISRRQLLRYSIGGAMGVWGLELLAGTIGFIWPNLSGGFGGKVRIGTLEDLKLANSSLPIAEGFPAYVPEARAFIVLIDAGRQQFVPGEDTSGDGAVLNVRSLYQRCPHLGCKPNPCVRNFWLECPCHGSRYDRLGIKAEGAQYGPAARSMDRFSASVDGDGVLTLDTGKITLGPLPVALGQPGIIPPRTPTGCI
jgi:cytochrome b6-f complex iron-sulfur subunit